MRHTFFVGDEKIEVSGDEIDEQSIRLIHDGKIYDQKAKIEAEKEAFRNLSLAEKVEKIAKKLGMV